MNTEAYSQAGSLGGTSNLPREGRGVRNGHIGRQQSEVSFGASPPGMGPGMACDGQSGARRTSCEPISRS